MAQATLGAEGFAAAWTAGAELPLDQILDTIDYAAWWLSAWARFTRTCS
jgi:hypothetical protein